MKAVIQKIVQIKRKILKLHRKAIKKRVYVKIIVIIMSLAFLATTILPFLPGTGAF